jgi:hypothetical protein
VLLSPLHSDSTDQTLVRSNGGIRSTPSRHVSRPSFEVVKDRIISEMDAPPKTKSSAKQQVRLHMLIDHSQLAFHFQALFRDGYRCLISGVFDIATCMAYREIEGKCAAEGSKIVETEVAHIFSQSAQDGDAVGFSTLVLLLLSNHQPPGIPRYGVGNVGAIWPRRHCRTSNW